MDRITKSNRESNQRIETPKRTKRPQKQPKTHQDGRKDTQDRPKRAQELPGTAQDPPKCSFWVLWGSFWGVDLVIQFIDSIYSCDSSMRFSLLKGLVLHHIVKSLSTQQLGPAECAKRLNPPPAPFRASAWGGLEACRIPLPNAQSIVA